MTDNTSKRGKQDRTRINLGQAHERAYWCPRLYINQKELRRIVGLVGPMVADVKKFLIDRINNA